MITLNLTADQVDALVKAAKDREFDIDLAVRNCENTLPTTSTGVAHIEDLRRRRSILIDAIAAVNNQRRRDK